MIIGTDDLTTLQLIQTEFTDILTYSKFTLSKWHSNCLEVQYADNEMKEVIIRYDITTTLGISWDHMEDTFHFKFRPNKSYSKNTKRSILSLTSTFFDSFGLVNSVVVRAKILLQKLWLIKCD